MPDADALAHQVPVVQRPAELVDQRGEVQRGVRNASGDHDVGPVCERLRDGLAPEVGVGRYHRGTQRRDRAGAVEQRQVAARDQVEHVVPGHRGDLQARQPVAAGDIRDHFGGGQRVGRAHVGDDPDAAPRAVPEHRVHPLGQPRVEPRPRVTPPLPLREGDGPLSEALEYQVVQLPVLGQLGGGLNAVIGEPGARPHSDRPHDHLPGPVSSVTGHGTTINNLCTYTLRA
jgi:hypothetical protein